MWQLAKQDFHWWEGEWGREGVHPYPYITWSHPLYSFSPPCIPNHIPTVSVTVSPPPISYIGWQPSLVSLLLISWQNHKVLLNFPILQNPIRITTSWRGGYERQAKYPSHSFWASSHTAQISCYGWKTGKGRDPGPSRWVGYLMSHMTITCYVFF